MRVKFLTFGFACLVAGAAFAVEATIISYEDGKRVAGESDVGADEG